MFRLFNESTIFLVSVKIQSEKCTGAVASLLFHCRLKFNRTHNTEHTGHITHNGAYNTGGVLLIPFASDFNSVVLMILLQMLFLYLFVFFFYKNLMRNHLLFVSNNLASISSLIHFKEVAIGLASSFL